ncbi:MAG: TPM domain-containing protein [Acidobacteria bacterium]|nr:TPM domain-containing protein [Acidobacteriota bacterium]
MRNWRSLFPLLLLAILPAAVRADVPKLEPRGYVNDFAGVLGQTAIARCDAVAAEVERKTGAQMAVVVVRSLDGIPIEDYANTLARRWGIGKKDNRGVLLLLAIEDRRDRLEVGYGLEPILPDGRVGGILRSLRPYMQQRDYDGAVLAAVDQLAGVIAQASGVTLEGQSLRRPPPQSFRGPPADFPWWVVLLGVVGILWLILKVGINPLFMLGGLGGWGGGGGGRGGGGWDGGGFSGFGGGDFGGGGASSGW